MDLKYLIKEELENYISELVPDNAVSPIQQKVKNLSKDDILLIPKANNRRYEIGFRDPEINAQFKADSEIGNPSIMIDPTNFNYILTVEPIPNTFRNLGLGKKIYEKLSDQLGFVSSSDKDKTTDTDRTVDATRVWDSLKRVSTNYFIEFPNRTIFLVSPDIQDHQEDQILDYFEKTKTDINDVVTNLPPNWKKGLELSLNRSKRPVPAFVGEMIQEAYDDVGVEFVKNKREKLKDYTNYDQKKVLPKVTLIHIKDPYPEEKWFLWGDIYAFDNEDGTEVGHVSYGKQHESSIMKASIDVRPDKRRMGIASEMYKWVEELTGETLHPDVPHSDSAAKLWGNPNRSFGPK